MKKHLLIFFLAVLSIGFLFGCSEEESITLETITASFATTEETAANVCEYSFLFGNWMVDGLEIDGKLYSIHVNSALEDLYDLTYLMFYEDGTYTYYNGFFTEGTYTPLEAGDGDAFLLKEERIYRLTFQDGEMVEVESTDNIGDLMIASMRSSGLLCYGEYDSVTGKVKAGETPLYFSKNGEPIIPSDSGK